MLTDTIRSYYNYAEWANGRILDAAERLTSRQFLESDPDHVWSIRDTLVHIMWGQWVWLERWYGTSQQTMFDPAEFPEVQSIRTRWQTINERTRAYLDEFTDETLARELTYTNLQGEPWTYRICDQMLHQSNHSTYHRGEVAALLTHFGASPGELDYLIYLDHLRGA